MNIEEIMELWSKDAVVNPTEIGKEALNISALHARYYSIFIRERLTLKRLESEFKQLRLAKHEFLTMGPDEHSREKAWRLPPRGAVLKTEVSLYLDADNDIIDLTLRIGLQQEKIDFLESILKVLMNRGYILRTTLDYMKFQSGA